MAITFTPVLNWRGAKTKTGIFNIFIRCTIDGASYYLKLDERIHHQFWIGSREGGPWIREAFHSSAELNTIVRNMKYKLENFVYRQRSWGNPVNISLIREFFNRRNDKNIFNMYVEEFMRRYNFNSILTRKKYDTFVKLINEFNPGLLFNQLNEGTFIEFKDFLRIKKLHAENTQEKYFDCFKKICRDCVKTGYLERNPFENINLGLKHTRSKPRIYLEPDEIRKLISLRIPRSRPALERTKAYFLFQIACSFYYSDLQELRWDNIHRDENVGFYITARRHKNSQDFVVPLYKFNFAIRILERQKGKDPVFVFPNTPTVQKYSKAVKELATLAGIKKNISNKTARHTGLQLWAAGGIEPQFLTRIAGHTNERQTRNYYEINLQDLDKRIQLIEFNI